MRLITQLRRMLGMETDEVPADNRPERLPSPDELVLLTRPQGEPEAQMLRGILEDNGIRSLVKSRDAISVQGGGMGPAWAFELWVLRKDLRRSRELLELDDAAQ